MYLYEVHVDPAGGLIGAGMVHSTGQPHHYVDQSQYPEWVEGLDEFRNADKNTL